MEEIWKDVIGYEGYYKISNYGKVKSLKRQVLRESHTKSKKIILKEKIMKPHKMKIGYYSIFLSKLNKRERYLMHRLMAIHFIDNPFSYKYINHINHDKKDFSINNLEWCTSQENNRYQLPQKRLKSSIYKGVNLHKQNKNWRAYICCKHIGSFDTEIEAALAYNAKALELFGKFACLNNV